MPPGIGYIDPMTGEWVPDSGLPSASQLGSYAPSYGEPDVTTSVPEELDYFQQGGQDGYLTPPAPISLPDVPVDGGPVSTKDKVRVARSGTDIAGLTRAISPGGYMGEAERGVRTNADAAASAEFDPLIRAADGAYAAQASAEGAVGQAEADIEEAKAAHWGRRADFLDKKYNEAALASQDQLISRLDGEEKQAAADYAQKRAEWLAMKVQPRDFTGSEAVAAGIEGWLATWGVKTNFTQTIQNRIRNDLDVQMHNAEMGRQVSAEFRQLYLDAKQGSRDARETRDKLELGVLDAMQARTEEDLAKGGAALKLKEGQAKIAELERLKLDTMASITNSRAAYKNQYVSQGLGFIEEAGRNARQKEMIEFQRETAKKAEEGAEAAFTFEHGVGNPFDGSLLGLAHDPAVRKAVGEKVASLKSMDDQYRQYIDTQQQLAEAGIAPEFITKALKGAVNFSEINPSKEDAIAFQKLVRQKAALELRILHYQKGAASEEDAKRIVRALPLDTSLTSYGSIEALHEARADAINEILSDTATQLQQASPAEHRSWRGGVTSATGFSDRKLEAGTLAEDANPKPASTPLSRSIDKMEKGAASAEPASKEWKGFWERAQKGNSPALGYSGETQPRSLDRKFSKDKQPEEISEALKTIRVYKRGLAEDASEKEKLRGAEAAQAIQRLATSNAIVSPFLRDYITTQAPELSTPLDPLPAAGNNLSAEDVEMLEADRAIQKGRAEQEGSYNRRIIEGGYYRK